MTAAIQHRPLKMQRQHADRQVTDPRIPTVGKPSGLAESTTHTLGEAPVRSHASASALRRLILATVAVVAVLSTSAPAHALREVEPFAPYQPQVSCDPVAKPGVVAFRHLVLRRFGGTDLGIQRDCSAGGDSEHKEGRAWDHGLNWHDKADRERAQQTLDWLTETVTADPARRAKRLGVMYIIWNEKIWSAYRAEDGWRPYTGASPHRDHIHFSFTWNGAMKRTSWWTNEVLPLDHGPCRRWIGELARPWRAPRLAPCPEPLARPVADERGMYIAQPDETVRRVARFFSVTGPQVRQWNGFAARGLVEISVGQRLQVVDPATLSREPFER